MPIHLFITDEDCKNKIESLQEDITSLKMYLNANIQAVLSVVERLESQQKTSFNDTAIQEILSVVEKLNTNVTSLINQCKLHSKI